MSERVMYVDSNVFTYFVIHDSREAHKAREILEDRSTVTYTSTLIWDEVVSVVRRVLGRPNSLQIGEKLTKFPNLRFIPVGMKVISKAQLLMQEYDLSPRDAIHCSSAVIKETEFLVSDDKDYDKVKEIQRLPISDFARIATT